MHLNPAKTVYKHFKLRPYHFKFDIEAEHMCGAQVSNVTKCNENGSMISI